MITRKTQFHRCDRCGAESFAGGCPEKDVVVRSDGHSGRHFYLCDGCYREVIAFCEGGDGPFSRIRFHGGRRGKADSLKDRLARGGAHNG